jgi:DNA-binding NtrC family response regulator
MSGEDGIPIIGDSPSIQAVIQAIERVAPTNAAVLLTGESGTGKELAARTIHDRSSRRAKPFVAYMPMTEPLVELDLFGYKRYVATGVDRHVGRIESANGGTLFLNDIGELSLTTQAKLLRVLEERELEGGSYVLRSVKGGNRGERELEWVGGGRPIPIDIRLIAATNKDFKDEVHWQCRFYPYFFSRLNVIHIHMPALRDIRTDIPVLATHFLREWATEYGRDIQGFSQDALKALVTYDWPGNVRHLKTAISRTVFFSEGKIIRADDLPRNTFDARESDGEVDPPR